MADPSAYDQHQISLANLPPTRRQARLALAGGAVLLLGFAALVPFAGNPLPRLNGFVPAFDAIISVSDFITAGLLLAQFSITRSRALWALACGYLFAAAIVVAHALTFPGAFPPIGDRGLSSHINFRIYLLWHLGLPMAIFAYIWLRDQGLTKLRANEFTEMAATAAGVGAVALASCVAWLAILPPVDPVAGRWLTVAVMSICAAALFLLWRLQRSALDQWLMVVILAMIIELAITGLIGAIVHTDDLLPIDQPRVATLGFYIGRLFSLVTSTVVLIALLAETSKLYAGVARANWMASAAKAAQTLSGEIELPKLIERLMAIALESAGADHGILILQSGDEYQVWAEGRATGDLVEVSMRREPITNDDFPQSAIRHVIRTRELLLLDDASAHEDYSKDDYVRRKRSRSVLCLPIVRQTKLVGVIYLENNLAPFVFTPDRVAIMQLLASQAAISLENAALYTDLQLQVELLQQLPVSAWTLKPDGTPDFVNQVWLDFSGQALDFVRSRPDAWMSAVHPEDREIAASNFWEGVRSGQGFAMETRTLRAQDGIYRWHLHQAVVLRDAEGKLLKFVGTSTDIDDLKRAEEAVRTSESQLRLMVDGIPGFLGVLGPAGEVQIVNRRQLEYFGLTHEQMKDWKNNGVVHPDDLPRAIAKFNHALATGTPLVDEHRYRRADGEYRWFGVEVIPARDTQGRITRWFSFSVDVHDRKLAEEAVRASEISLRQTLDTIPGLVAKANANGTIELANPQLLKYFGKTIEEMNSWSNSGVVHPDDLPRVTTEITHSFQTGTPFDSELRYRRADGVHRWFHARSLPFCGADSEVAGWYFLLTDIEDRKRTEEALRQAQAELALINRVTTMGEIAASLAHEISQPISGAITNANVGLRKLGSDSPNLEEVRGIFGRIVRDTQRAAEIVRRIRSQFEKGDPKREGLDVNEIIPETIALLRDEAMRHNVSVRTELAADLPQIVGDRVQLQQVAMNLIVNSIEAMKDVEGMRETIIRSQRAEGEQILVSVSDTGPGIPSKLVEQIFDPFFTTKNHGTGMGLRICRSIIEAHGGRLWAAANESRGATFHFTLPAVITNQR